MNKWDEKNYIEQKKNSLSSNEHAQSGSMNATESGSTQNAWNATGSISQMYKMCYNGETGEYLGDNKSHVVYLWTETRDGMEYPCYVGQTRWNIHKRIKDHLVYDDPFLFQRKLRKRPNIYKCYIITQENNPDTLDELETKYILEHNTFHDYNKTGYNLLIGTKNHIVSDVVRKKISERLKENHPFRGKHHTEETKEKIRKSRALYKTPQHVIDKMLEGCKKAIRTEEWKNKISQAQKGRKFSEQHKEKLSFAKIGKKQSKEHIENRMKKIRGRKVPEKLKSQISNKLMGHTNNSSTGVCGVSKRCDRYLANGPMVNGKRKHLGIFETIEEAKRAVEKHNKSINKNE